MTSIFVGFYSMTCWFWINRCGITRHLTGDTSSLSGNLILHLRVEHLNGQAAVAVEYVDLMLTMQRLPRLAQGKMTYQVVYNINRLEVILDLSSPVLSDCKQELSTLDVFSSAEATLASQLNLQEVTILEKFVRKLMRFLLLSFFQAV